MGSTCNSKLRQATPSTKPYELEGHVFIQLEEKKCVKVMNCPMSLEDSFKEICGTAIVIANTETKLKDKALKKALKNFVPEWYAYKNGETCLVEEIEIGVDKKPFKPSYGSPLMSHPTFIFAGNNVKKFTDGETRSANDKDADEFFGPFGEVARPVVEEHFYIRKGGKIVSYEGRKLKTDGFKPLTFLAKVMLAKPSSSDVESNSTCVLSARQLSNSMGNRRNWTIKDIEGYFDQLSDRQLGSKKMLEQYKELEERKNRGLHLHPDTLFYKKVTGERQTVELHKLGLQTQERAGTLEIVPRVVKGIFM
mmetsp:Transcript_23574/g.35310  ORF Transcript_23574/g.35310 Transcript_23574/m.35310 type:complete len:308 (-) Transcript_23574:93-1016(-)